MMLLFCFDLCECPAKRSKRESIIISIIIPGFIFFAMYETSKLDNYLMGIFCPMHGEEYMRKT